MILPVAVIGAGPFGLSTAAHLRGRGIPVRIFGSPMVSWRDHMPAGMLLKSTPVASTIDAPQPGHTLLDFCADTGGQRYESDWDLIPVEDFARYGQWFAESLFPDLEQVRVVSVDRVKCAFELKLDSGETFKARAVVVATGLSGLARMPRELAAAVPEGPSATGPVSHASQHHDLSVFAGREVVVVGAGQSALENAVLMAEAGAKVRIVARTPGAVAFGDAPDRQPKWAPESPFGRAWSLYALSYHATHVRHLPAPARHYLVRRVLGPLGAWWLRERFTNGGVHVTDGRRVVRARVEDGRPVLTLGGRSGGPRYELAADHVMAATGYRMDVAALDFLGHELRTALVTTKGAPVLDAGYGSSVPGLYFTGLPASSSFGPLMRFVCGTEYASPRLAAAVAGLS
ncbi:NAD(P)/FAD-dependent oxidoreductase [Streptomyces sannanensis]|uniref:NAD(P)/FAD-dependent oxidoreductase n=1 Tax=Streptomyces sannanensis TaxID=285536 RepID=A0ABP6SDT0_9ACTN